MLSGIEATQGTLLFSFDGDRDGAPDRSRVLDLATIRVGRGRGDVTLGNVTLSRNGTIVGKVLLGDRATLPAGHAGTDVVLQGLPSAARTGDDGSFLLQGVPEGSLVLTASRAGYVSDATALTVGAAEEKRIPPVVLQATTGLEPVGRLTGTVVSSERIPLVAVEVTLSGAAARMGLTDVNGRFTFEAIPSGVYSLVLSRSGYVVRSVTGLTVATSSVEVGPYVLEALMPDAGAGGGAAGGIAGGTAGGSAGGVAGGAAGGAAGGSSGGAAGGASGGTGGGTGGGSADTVPPVVTLMASANTVLSNGNVTLTAFATDNTAVTEVELYEGLSRVDSTTTPSMPGRFSFVRSFTSANNGPKQFVVRAFDAARNQATSNTVTVNVAIVAATSPRGFGWSDGCRYVVLNDGRVLATSRGFGAPGACAGLSSPGFLGVNGLTGVVRASTHSLGVLASLFVRNDGSLACISAGTLCGPATLSPPNVTLVPGVSDAVWAASGPTATCLVRSDSTAACWSGDYLGSSGGPTNLPRTVTWADGGVITGATRVHSCSNFTVLQLANGQLVSFGRNDSVTPIGVGFVVPFFGTPPSSVVDTLGQPVRNVVDFACGREHAIISTADAGLLGFGRTLTAFAGNAPFGNPGLALESRFDSAVPAAVGLSQVVDVECGQSHTVGLDTSGQVWVWGRNQSGQLGNGTTTTSAVPIQLTGLPPITAVAAGEASTLALAADGRVFAWGLSSEIGIPDAGMTVLTPRTVDLP
ncbi:MAG: carboxypeptidase regulatory-like domain-containing protein [Myxococcaceae bacterium]|nr:carboxypeptidase regulatory-like domain-containing protein [Myxococcaceae bacterium]